MNKLVFLSLGGRIISVRGSGPRNTSWERAIPFPDILRPQLPSELHNMKLFSNKTKL